LEEFFNFGHAETGRTWKLGEEPESPRIKSSRLRLETRKGPLSPIGRDTKKLLVQKILNPIAKGQL
jgi:hypothetical protein